MNHILNKFSFLLIVTFSSVCLSGEKVSRTMQVDAQGIVFVEIPRGLVKIKGWNKNEVMIQGELDDTIKNLIFKNKKSKTLIKVDTEGKKHWGDVSILNIYMPQSAQLRFKGIDTSFSIAKLTSHIEGKSINGNLMIRKSNGKIKLSVVSGDVKVADSSGIMKVESVSGSVNFSGDFDKAYLKSMSGDIIGDISGMNELTIKNISGDTQIRGSVKSKSHLNISSVSGDVYYKVTGDLNAACEVVSQFGGDINNELTDDLPEEASLHKKTLSFVSGDGSGELNLKTVTGSVTIEKAIN